MENYAIYDLAISFFKRIIELDKSNKYDFLVLTTRRCFCLFFALLQDSVFLTKFSEYSNEQNYLKVIEEKAISSQKIDILNNEFSEKNILILDDIMIHGHAVFDIYQQILSFLPQNIDTLVMIRNIENPDCYYREINKTYYYIQKLPNTEWREISNNLVQYLHDMGHCYTSYIYGFTVPTAEVHKSLQKSLQNSFTNKIDLNLSSYVSYKEFKSNSYPNYYKVKMSYPFVKKAILRTYELTGEQHKSRVIPYVELKEFNSDALEKSWKKIWFGEEIPSELHSLKTKKDKYRALAAICSISLYRMLFKDLSLECTYELDKSFVSGFVDIVLSHTNEKRVFNIIEKCFLDIQLQSSNTLMEKTLKCFNLCEYINKNDNEEKLILNYLQKYFYIVTEQEEVYKKSNNWNNCCELKPIATSMFYLLSNEKCLNYKQTSIFDGILTYFMDVGIFSHVVEDLDDDVVGTCLKAGEQSYHLFADISKNAYRAIYILLKYLNRINDDKLKNRIVFNFLVNLKRSNNISEEYREIIEFFVKHPPVDLNESYYGVLKERNKNITKSDETVAIQIIQEIYKIMDITMKESCCECKFAIFE